MKIRKALVVYYVHNYRTLRIVESALKKNGIRFVCLNREKVRNKDVKGTDAVIVVGGDGTFLRVAHLISGSTPVLVISSDINRNEAFYSRATRGDVSEKIARLAEGKYRITKLPRLEAKINKKLLPILSVNEIFVGSSRPYHTSRYVIEVNGKSELQKSSGVLITTKMGSTGWARSAAKTSLKIPEGGFGFVVREPYIGRLTKPGMLYAYLPANGLIRIKSLTHKGIVVVDSSDREFRFDDGAILEVSVSKKPLSFIEF